jgi:Skp family chaperone for outer membrane proteins
VKRIVGLLAGVATLGVGVYWTSHLWAQQGNYPQNRGTMAPLQSKVYVINLGQVIKNYAKFKSFEEQLKAESQTINRDLENKRAQAIAKQKEIENPALSPAAKDELVKEVKRMERDMQEIVEDAKQKIAKREFDNLVQIYREVQAAVETYARAYAIELVLQYSDAVGADVYTPANFQHKLSNRACMPIYVDPRMDITEPVTAMLNQKLASSGATQPRGN